MALFGERHFNKGEPIHLEDVQEIFEYWKQFEKAYYIFPNLLFIEEIEIEG